MSEKLISKAKELMTELGKMVQTCKTRSEADELYTNFISELGEDMANTIWDDYVDWEKVNWNE